MANQRSASSPRAVIVSAPQQQLENITLIVTLILTFKHLQACNLFVIFRAFPYLFWQSMKVRRWMILSFFSFLLLFAKHNFAKIPRALLRFFWTFQKFSRQSWNPVTVLGHRLARRGAQILYMKNSRN